ncbi:MAG TPA: VOC family protein, partial [Nakamurella sp.]|nr:VOC family protein [Nakamurella sp.]
NGPRLFFQKVPEGKTAKNRVHLDVSVGRGITDPDERWRAVTAHVDTLVSAGATIVEERRNDQFGDHWMVMTDPDGNEFCVQ